MEVSYNQEGTTVTTTLENKIAILGKLWLDYKFDEDFQDFIEYNDVGLPLAFIVSENLATLSESGEKYLDETWNLFLESIGIEDVGFEDLNQVFIWAQEKGN